MSLEAVLVHGTLQEFLSGKELRLLKEAHSGDLHRQGVVIQVFSRVGCPNENADFSHESSAKISMEISKEAMQCVILAYGKDFS